MEDIIDTPTLAVICGLIVLVVGYIVIRVFEKAEKADKIREERTEFEEWLQKQARM